MLLKMRRKSPVIRHRFGPGFLSRGSFPWGRANLPETNRWSKIYCTFRDLTLQFMGSNIKTNLMGAAVPTRDRFYPVQL